MNHRRAAATIVLEKTAAMLGCSVLDLQVKQAMSRHLEEKQDFGRIYAMLGDLALTKAGSDGSFGQQLFHRLWRAPAWIPAYNQFVEPVRDALVKVAVSTAGSVVAPMANAAQSGAGNIMSTFAALMLAGTAAGSGLGALNWHLKQQTRGDDEQNQELDAKAKMYKSLATQINNDLRLRDWHARSGA